MRSFELLEEYHSKKLSAVKLDSIFSSFFKILLAVLEGSILGTELFLKNLKDLILFNEKTDKCNFGDDKALCSCLKSFSNVFEIMIMT